MSTVYAQRSCGVVVERGSLHVARGSAWESSHEVVKRHPGLFGEAPPDEAVVGRQGPPVVETATRAPGEVRRTPRKRKA